jgi:hypothetical protein
MANKDPDGLLITLQARFEKHPTRHPDVSWKEVAEYLTGKADKWETVCRMEQSGGEPDAVVMDGGVYYADFSKESPGGRRSLCFDPEALMARKEYKPEHSATGMAEEMGITLLTEAQYRHIQSLGPLDTKTSSWIQTPAPIRKLGGALFGDYRYGTVFIYHNGASSYYAARGFRGCIRLW